MFHIPPRYYYDHSSEHETYSEIGDELDINRLMQGKSDCWVSRHTHQEKKPKTLIISDFFLKERSHSDLNELHKKLRLLLEQQFTLYLWQDNRLVELNQDSLWRFNDIKTSSNITPAFSNDIIEYVVKSLKQTRQSVLLLNDVEIDALLHNKEPEKTRAIKASYWKRLNKQQQKHLLAILAAEKPPLTDFIIDVFPDDEKTLNIPQGLKTIHQQQFFSVGNNNIALPDERLMAPTIELEFDTLVSTKDKFLPLGEKLRALHFNCYRADQDQRLIAAAPELQALSIKKFDNNKKVPHLNTPMPHLQYLNLSVQLDAATLQNVLQATPNLRQLSLLHSCSEDSYSSFKLPAKSLEHLHSLELSESPPELLRALLQSAPNLKKLTFTRFFCEFKPEYMSVLIQHCPPNLHSLSLNAKMNATHFQELLRKTPKLKQLYLSNVDKEIISVLFHLCPSDLEELMIEGDCPITLEQLRLLLLTATKLHSLILPGRSLSPDALILLIEHCPPELRHLNLNYQPITGRQLQLLLLNAPQLHTLGLMQCEYLCEDDSSITLNRLPKLRNLYIGCSLMNGELLNQILNVAPSLELLYAYNTPHICFADLSPPNQKRVQTLDKESFNHTSKTTSIIPKKETVFNADDFLNITCKTREFHYPNHFTGFNEEMIIAKLSYYLKHRSKFESNEVFVRSIQAGINPALAHYFCYDEGFSAFFERMKVWDPMQQPQPVDSLANDFNTLHDYVLLYQKNKTTHLHLGKNWTATLQSKTIPMILNNSWKTIGLKPSRKKNHWILYDPNASQGAKEVSFAQLGSEVERCLGNNIHITISPSYGIPAPNFDYAHSAAISEEVPDNFLSQGGLLSLTLAKNWKQILNTVQKKGIEFAELEKSLFLRDTKSIPAWYNGLCASEVEVRGYTMRLLRLYEAHHRKEGKSFQQPLTSSLSHLTDVQLKEVTHVYPDVAFYLQPFIDEHNFPFWCKGQLSLAPASDTHGDLKSYCQALINEKKHSLIHCQATTDTWRLQMHLFQEGIQQGRPVFLVNSPDELHCGRYIDAQGKWQPGPGGALYDFLVGNQHKEPILLINYDRFKDSDYPNHHSLFDTPPTIDGVSFPSLRVIGLQDRTRPNAYLEADFISRLPNQHQAFDQIPPLATRDKEATTKAVVSQTINLYHSPYWKTELLGQWVPHQGGFRYQQGALERMLASQPDLNQLILSNGPDKQDEYRTFWEHALCLGYIMHQNHRIDLPKHLTVSQEQHAYNWENLKKNCFIATEENPGTVEIINPGRFQRLFQQYTSERGQLIWEEGMLATTAKQGKKILSLHVTRNLSEAQWAKLLAKAQENGIFLIISVSPDIMIPQELNKTTLPAKATTQKQKDVIHPPRDCVLLQLYLPHAPSIVRIDISEARIADLFTSLQSQDREKGVLAFQQREGAVISALNARKTVVLTGKIPELVMDELHALIQQRRLNPKAQGSLHIMPSTFTPQADLTVFERLDNAPAEDIEAERFMQQRIAACETVLRHSPFVVLTGLSGVGKTSFVEKELCAPHRHYQHNNIQEWLEAESSENDTYELLFIDEANLKNSDFSMFQDLFNNPPTVLYQGKVYPLSPQHKVVFATNPLSYAAGRSLPALFQQHGKAVVFNPLPKSVIVERILKPVFPLPTLRADLINIYWSVYDTLCRYSDSEILISPRELQMMALLTQSHCKAHGTDPIKTAAHFAYTLAAPLVPRSKANEFAARFKPAQPLTEIPLPTATKQFTLTASRQPTAQYIQQLLQLRQQRQQNPKGNEAQLYGGLGGLVIEGPSGVGKSELLIYLLRSAGLTEIPLAHYQVPPDKQGFYRIPANASPAQKKKWLCAAFHQGAVVILDEINSSAMLESYLNHLLMGKDEHGKAPRTPGFLLLGTQNPATFSGRQRASEALSRRLHQQVLDEYPLEELIQIVQNMNVPEKEAKIMSQQWQETYYTAKSLHRSPPTFRALQQLYEAWRNKKAAQITINNSFFTPAAQAERRGPVATTTSSAGQNAEHFTRGASTASP